MHGDVEVAPGPQRRGVSARARELQHIISIRGKKRKEGAKREGATMVIADDDNGAMRMKRI